MTTTELKKQMKQTLDKVDSGEKVLITRGGKVYTITRVKDI